MAFTERRVRGYEEWVMIVATEERGPVVAAVRWDGESWCWAVLQNGQAVREDSGLRSRRVAVRRGVDALLEHVAWGHDDGHAVFA